VTAEQDVAIACWRPWGVETSCDLFAPFARHHHGADGCLCIVPKQLFSAAHHLQRPAEPASPSTLSAHELDWLGLGLGLG
jgi:hypothetical protein